MVRAAPFAMKTLARFGTRLRLTKLLLKGVCACRQFAERRLRGYFRLGLVNVYLGLRYDRDGSEIKGRRRRHRRFRIAPLGIDLTLRHDGPLGCHLLHLRWCKGPQGLTFVGVQPFLAHGVFSMRHVFRWYHTEPPVRDRSFPCNRERGRWQLPVPTESTRLPSPCRPVLKISPGSPPCATTSASRR